MMTMFDLGDVVTFFIQQVSCNIDGNLSLKSRCTVFKGLFLKNTKHLDGTGFCIANGTDAVASGAGNVAAFVERRTESLTREFQQAEAGDLGDLDTLCRDEWPL